MGFMDTLAISASGMTAERLRMDVVANNLANVNTTRTPGGGPFRRQQVAMAPATASFGDTLAGLSGDDDGSETVQGGVQVAGIVPDMRPFKRVYQPGHPDADAQGYVSLPNVDTVTEMVDMMSATRAYEANVAAVGAVKSMAMKALEIGRA
ncbi:MAG: flagellar basal body rod protein FlgC [Armatimonadota bacterium]|nr:flagellar basal body rod protein FlgC [Armatimonadota bacterium]